MNTHASLLAGSAVVLIFGLVLALILMPHFSRVHAGDGAGMKIAAFAIGLFLLIALVLLRNR